MRHVRRLPVQFGRGLRMACGRTKKSGGCKHNRLILRNLYLIFIVFVLVFVWLLPAKPQKRNRFRGWIRK